MGCRVFLLDDEDAVRGGLRRQIEATRDLRVVGESCAVTGTVDKIARARPDVAILDIRLPDGSGVEVGRALRDQLPDVRCLMLTACPEKEAIVASTEAGASGYLSKPINGTDLRSAIRWITSGEAPADPTVTFRLFDHLLQTWSVTPSCGNDASRARQMLNLVPGPAVQRRLSPVASRTPTRSVPYGFDVDHIRHRTDMGVGVKRLLVELGMT